jgi:filamentous hemagglutinin family protein
MSNVWAASKSGWLILRNIPVYISSSATNNIYGGELTMAATSLQDGGGNYQQVDNVSDRNPFTVAKTNGYVDAGVWNASDILIGSPYTNIRGVIRINPKPLTIAGVVANRVYDGTMATTLNNNVAKNGLVGLTGSQTLDVVYTSAAFQNKNAGNNKTVDITYTASDGTNGGKLSNYILPTTTTANITPKPVSVVIVGGANLVFDRVAEGGASVTTSGKTTTATQTTDKAVLDWMRLSLGKDETLLFNQPNSSSIVLNRVVTDLPSVIEGTLKANGRVFLLNAGGILFTANSRVSVGALVASTFNLKDDDFLKNNYVFTVAQGTGSVIAEGDIVIAENGFVTLAGNHDVRHTGTINGGGAALFASTDSLTLNLEGRAVAPRPALYTIGDLAGTTTVGGRINIGSTTKGGELLTAGTTVATDGLTLATGTGGAWVYDQNDAITIGAGRFTGAFVNDNLNTRNLSLRSRNGDITVNAAVEWTANTTLGLSAKNDIFINKSIKATGANAGLVMNYGGDYHLITPATFSGAVLDSTGKPVAKTIPVGTEFTDIALSGANAKLNINGNDYTLIHSMDEFAALDDATGMATGYFALTNNLDAAAWSAAHTGMTSVVGSLSGTLAGLGHKVDNLTLNAPLAAGIIGQVVTNAGISNVIRDIGVTNVDITGAGGIGALAGIALDTVIRQAYSTGKISATNGGVVGGLVGRAGSRIDSSYSDVDITASGDKVGGLVGIAADEIILVGSHASGDITGPGAIYYYVNRQTGERTLMYDAYGRLTEPPIENNYYIATGSASEVGGLLGAANYANVDKSYASGNVSSVDGGSIGGLIGTIMGSWAQKPFQNAVTNSFATGDVIGGANIGGLIGEVGGMFLDASSPIKIDNVYATGNVTGTRGSDGSGVGRIGGLIGSSRYSNINNSYATGNVITIADGRTDYMGGLVGRQEGGSIGDSYASGTVIGNGGRYTGGLAGGNAGAIIDDSYYQDANTVAASETTPVRMETGGIVDNVRLSESGNTRKERERQASRVGSGSGVALDQYIYRNDGDGYSARVKAVSVEASECEDDDGDCDEQ